MVAFVLFIDQSSSLCICLSFVTFKRPGWLKYTSMPRRMWSSCCSATRWAKLLLFLRYIKKDQEDNRSLSSAQFWHSLITLTQICKCLEERKKPSSLAYLNICSLNLAWSSTHPLLFHHNWVEFIQNKAAKLALDLPFPPQCCRWWKRKFPCNLIANISRSSLWWRLTLVHGHRCQQISLLWEQQDRRRRSVGVLLFC